ncbi:MAG TPA: type II secretion system protein [Planctomycetota bacterium]|nr:type II secretion system protein [Planctomycetota bacterium]
MHSPRRTRGFTLIELLVVMAIIATLAGLGMAGIPAIMRSADKAKCQDNLREIGKMLRIYETDHNGLPDAEGAAFVLATWGRYFDKNEKNAKIFYCPSTKNKPPADLADMTPDAIDYTGPMTRGMNRRNRLSMSEPNAAVKAISGNKVPDQSSSESLDTLKDSLPHAGKGVCVLYLDGSTGWIESADFQDEIVQYGPESQNEQLKLLKPGFDG